MPYIQQYRRRLYDVWINKLLDMLKSQDPTSVKGDLNYIISRIVAGTYHPVDGNWRYNAIAEVTGTFECAKLEFYRRVASPKEDTVVDTNGDIQEYQCS